MRILLVEDSERLQRSITRGLRASGYAVDCTGSGSDGLWRAESNQYDVIILDLMLPDTDGLTVLKKLREKKNQTNVIILTARDTVDDRVLGLRSGADDYLIKPFSFDELLARIETLIRRSHGEKSPIVKVGSLSLDTAAKSVTVDGKRIDLLAREYALLEFFIHHRGQVVSRTQIESSLYDDRADVMSNVVDAAVYALRKKLDQPGKPSMIQTRRGMGYLFDETT